MNYKLLIVIILLGGISIIAASVSIGIMKRDVQVEESPYEAGLKFEETMKQYEKLGWTLDIPREITAGAKQLQIALVDRDRRPIDDARLECVVGDNTRHETRRVSCAYSGNAGSGLYRCAFDLDNPGYRDVRIKVSRAADEMMFDKQIIVAK